MGNDIYETIIEPNSSNGYADILSQMGWLEDELHDLRKKRKKTKKVMKKGGERKGRIKKINKRIKAIEHEMQQMKYVYTELKSKGRKPKGGFWSSQREREIYLSKSFDLATAILKYKSYDNKNQKINRK